MALWEPAIRPHGPHAHSRRPACHRAGLAGVDSIGFRVELAAGLAAELAAELAVELAGVHVPTGRTENLSAHTSAALHSALTINPASSSESLQA